MASTVRLTGERQREHAKRMIDDAPDGYVMKLAPETRRDAQNKLLWAALKEIRDQVPGMDKFSPEDIKSRFMHAFGAEMRFLPDLENEGFFPVGMRTSMLTVQQFAGLMEMIFAWGSSHGVQWKAP